MRKVSDIITDIVTRQAFLEEALSYNFLNLTAFAEYIQKQVEKEAAKSVSVHAIKMALSRMKIRENFSLSSGNHFSRISTRTGLSIMTLVRSSKSIELVTQFMTERKKDTKWFFTMIEWMHEIDIIFETNDSNIIQEKFPQSLQILVVSWLGLISWELSDLEISTPWLFYNMTKRLAFHGVNIIQVLSTYHELGIIMQEEDIKKGMNLLMD